MQVIIAVVCVCIGVSEIGSGMCELVQVMVAVFMLVSA